MLRSFQVWLPTTSSNCEAYWTLHLFAQPLLPKLFSTCRIQGRRIRRTRRTRSRRTRTRRTRRASPQRCSMALMGLALKNKNELVHDNKRICFHRMALKQSVPPLWCLSWLLQWFCLLFPHVFVHRKKRLSKMMEIESSNSISDLITAPCFIVNWLMLCHPNLWILHCLESRHIPECQKNMSNMCLLIFCRRRFEQDPWFLLIIVCWSSLAPNVGKTLTTKVTSEWHSWRSQMVNLSLYRSPSGCCLVHVYTPVYLGSIQGPWVSRGYQLEKCRPCVAELFDWFYTYLRYGSNFQVHTERLQDPRKDTGFTKKPTTKAFAKACSSKTTWSDCFTDSVWTFFWCFCWQCLTIFVWCFCDNVWTLFLMFIWQLTMSEHLFDLMTMFEHHYTDNVWAFCLVFSLRMS